jgi:ABC-2 type transport system permease protein
MNRLTVFARQEIRSTLRDRRFRAVTLTVWALLLTATLVGFSSAQKLRAERERAQREARNQWLGQGDKNPHSAAHYGTYAFRPHSALSFVDFGLDRYLGNVIYLEGHRQNPARFSAAQDGGTLLRFGELTVAFVLQLLVPLLVIFLCFNAVTREREDNTLRMLLGQGASGRQIVFGKILGLSAVAGVVVVPALLLSTALLIFTGESALTSDVLARSGLLFLFYLLYAAVFVVGSVLVSAHARSSTVALLTLLGFWVLACVLLPKATANLGATLHEAPSRFAFSKALHEDEEKGLDGHNPQDARMKDLEKKILARYGVDSVSQLPINFDGLAMQEGEKYTTLINNKHFGNLRAVYQRQNAVADWASLLNPYLAVRNLSMGLAGNDYAQFVDFQQKAEAYRFRMVEFLNYYLRDHSKTGDWEFKVNIWDDLPDFTYTAPTVGTVLGGYGLAIASLVGWVLGGLALVFFTTNRLRVG